jgi:4-hydroxyphenylacetate 3-monooxygenase
MLRTGPEYLDSLRDGRRIYIGGERVNDVTTHPAFQRAARTVAGLFDLAFDPATREAITVTDGSAPYRTYFLKARSRDDLERRLKAHRLIADRTHGLFGRSPDHVASFVTGMAMNPAVFKTGERPYERHIVDYYERIRRDDLYVCYAIIPPQGARTSGPNQAASNNLTVTAERDDGVVLNGVKMLATGAVFADEVWIGNIFPLKPDQAKASITCSVPVNAPGLSLWSRTSYERAAKSEFDSPLAYRFDETDSLVIFEDVFVPWGNVFTHDDIERSRAIYHETPAHTFGNHQSNVRFWSRLRLILGIASKIAKANAATDNPAVRAVLGELAAHEAALSGMIYGQIQNREELTDGYVCFNRRHMYAALDFCTRNYWDISNTVRELLGGGMFQMPADSSVMDDPALVGLFERYFQTSQQDAVSRMKLFKLSWDLLGTEFASRHFQYEKFYAGAPFVIKGHNDRECPWGEFEAIVDGILDSYPNPVAAGDGEKLKLALAH